MAQNKIKSKMRFTKHKCNVDDPYSPYCIEVSVEDVINSYLERLADDLSSGPFIDVELSREMQDNEQEILFRCTNSAGTACFSKMVIDMQPTTENQVEVCEIDLAPELLNRAADFFDENDTQCFMSIDSGAFSVKLARDIVDQKLVGFSHLNAFDKFCLEHRGTIKLILNRRWRDSRACALVQQPAVLIVFMLLQEDTNFFAVTAISKEDLNTLRTIWRTGAHLYKVGLIGTVAEIDLAESLSKMAAAFFEHNDIPTFTYGVHPRSSIKLLRDLVDQNEVNNDSIEEFSEFLHKHKRTILKIYSDDFDWCNDIKLLLPQPAILIIFMLSSYGRRCHEFTDISENEMSDLSTTWDVAWYCSRPK